MKVAVLVDGDNADARWAKAVLGAAKRNGTVNVARVYVNGTKEKDWLDEPGFRPILAGTEKNSSDILLCIDAMEIALSGAVGVFVIVSNDGDFRHIALRLRERGLKVVGIGGAMASKAFVGACSEFVRMGAAKAKATATAKVQEPQSYTVTELDRNLKTLIAANSKNGKGMRVADINGPMREKYKVKISKLKDGSWPRYFRVRERLYDIDPRGPDAMVRFKPEGFS